MSRRAGLRLTVAALVIAGTIVVGASAGTAEPVDVPVEVTNFAFNPSPVTVTVGDTVVWQVLQGFHAISSDDGTSFNSQAMTTGQEFRWTPSEPGSYAYYDRFYGGPQGRGMSGVVEVVASPDPTTTTTTTAPPPDPTTTTTAPPPVSSTTTTQPPAPGSSTTTTTRPTTTTTAPPASGGTGGSTTTTRPGGTTSTTRFTFPMTASPSASEAATHPAAGSPGLAGITVPAPSSATPGPDKAPKASTGNGSNSQGSGKHRSGGGSDSAATDAAPVPVPDGFGQITGDLIPGFGSGSSTTKLPTLAELALAASGEPASAPSAPASGGGGHLGLELVAVLMALLLLGSAGWAWYHRPSRYLPA